MQQFIVLVYFTAGFAICGLMANHSVASDIPQVKRNTKLPDAFADKDTILYNHFTQ